MKNRVAAGFLGLFLAIILAMSAAGPSWGQARPGPPDLIPPALNMFQWQEIQPQLSRQIASNTVRLQTQALNAQEQAQLLQQQAALNQINSELAAANSSINALLATIASSISATSSVLASMSTPLSSALSCPVFAGEGTLLGEDSCAWSKATGQRTSQYGFTTDSAGIRLGGQKEIADHWFLGGALGAGSTWAQAAGGFASLGQTFDGSVALKHVRGPWLFAAALAAATSATHTTRVPGTGNIMQADSNVFQGGVRLRGAYDFAFTGWYARPRLDLDAYYTNMAGFQEYGTAPTAMVVSGNSKVSTAIAPTLELGGRIAAGTLLGDGTILRPYVAVGAIFLPDNVWTIDVSFTGAAAQFGSFRNLFQGPSVLGTVEAGLQLYRAHGMEVKAEYRLAAGESLLNQSVGLRGAWHF